MHEALRRSLMNRNLSLFGVSLLAAMPLNDVVAKLCTFHNFESNPRSPRNLPWVTSLALRFRSRQTLQPENIPQNIGRGHVIHTPHKCSSNQNNCGPVPDDSLEGILKSLTNVPFNTHTHNVSY